MLLEGIETLLVLDKTKTMSKAGSQLYVSQSAISKRIAYLEKKLGKKLIEPDGRFVRLTPAAQTLVATIEPTFRELCGQIYENQSVESHTLLCLDCSETLVSGFLSQFFGQYVQQDPYITLTTNHTPRIIEHVRSGQATLGICAGHLSSSHGLVCLHVADEPQFVISQEPLSALPEKLITNDLTNYANQYQTVLFNKLGICPVMEIDSYTAAAHLALAGVAPALIPLSVARTLGIQKAHLFQFSELSPLSRPIHLCVRKNNYHQPRVKALVEASISVISEAVLSSTQPMAS